jgi:hypothetical protein
MTNTERWAETKEFWLRCVEALSRLAAAAIFALADRLFQLLLEYTVFKSGSSFIMIAENVSNVAFVLLDLYLLWDMLAVFLPQLKGRQVIEQVEEQGQIK